MMVAPWFPPFLAFLVSFFVLKLLLLRGSRLPLDHPNERSLHVNPTPRIGGLGVMAGLAACLPFVGSGSLVFVCALALFLSAMSLVDDFRGLSVSVRFLAQFVAAGLALWALPDMVVPALAVLVIALVWMTNLFNFMDGADGLAGGMALIGFASYGVAAGLGGADGMALVSWALAAGTAGFLLMNFPPARVFMGDAGSVPLGFLGGALGFWGWTAGVWPWAFPLVVFSPFIVDASLTLVKRQLRGEKVWQAHRNHYYQRLVRMGWSHRKLALMEYGLMLLAGASGLLLLFLPEGQVVMLVVWGAVYGVLAWVIDQRWRRSQAC